MALDHDHFMGIAVDLSRQAAAQGNRPLGSPDVMARAIAGKFTENWGQQVVVDNRPGASTTIAADLAAKAPPDGNTLLMMTDNHVTNPSLFRKLPYDSEKDFAPITLAALAPFLLVVHPSVPANSVKELALWPKHGLASSTMAPAASGRPAIFRVS